MDDAGNAYLIGSAYEDHYTLDVMVVKLDPLGNEVWTYYYSGSGHSFATGIALDSSGHPWVTGWTGDSDFPLVDPIDTQFDAREIFLMQFDPADGSVLYSTYIGGDYTDTGEAIVINDQDEIYIGGTSGSTDFPTTPDAWQTEPSAPLYIYQDAVIVKLSPTRRRDPLRDLLRRLRGRLGHQHRPGRAGQHPHRRATPIPMTSPWSTPSIRHPMKSTSASSRPTAVRCSSAATSAARISTTRAR